MRGILILNILNIIHIKHKIQEKRLQEMSDFKLMDEMQSGGNVEIAQKIWDNKYKSKYGEATLQSKKEYNSAKDAYGNEWGWEKGNPFKRSLIAGKTDSNGNP